MVNVVVSIDLREYEEKRPYSYIQLNSKFSRCSLKATLSLPGFLPHLIHRSIPGVESSNSLRNGEPLLQFHNEAKHGKPQGQSA